MNLSESSLYKSFNSLSEKHLVQIQALTKVSEFLDLIATTELKCAQLLNQIEEYKLGPLSKVLTPGVISFL